MKITLVSHASVVIDCIDATIWTDPWLRGTAFNDSWALCPPAVLDPTTLERVSHLWISHEHPDHFHIATLRELPAPFKQRVVVLFQKNNSQKMFDAFRRLGFRNFQSLPHRRTLQLTPATWIYCYQEGQINSCLAVGSGGVQLLNVNDAELRRPDCDLIVRDIGRPDVVLNQFSIAGYSGQRDRETRLKALAATILRNVADNHRDLGAMVTIPFASFVRFCASDNVYVNEFANRVSDTARFMSALGLEVVVLAPGETFEVGGRHDSVASAKRIDDAWSAARAEGAPVTPSVPLSRIREAFVARAQTLRDRYGVALRVLGAVTARIPDLDTTVRFSLAAATFEEVPRSSEADVEINSQPLEFMFKFPFGLQTLGVSARYVLLRGERNWRLHRIFFAMDNAEVYLRPKYLLTKANARHIAARMNGGLGQIRRRLETMM